MTFGRQNECLEMMNDPLCFGKEFGEKKDQASCWMVYI